MIKLRKRTKNKRGFTLIETVIALAVIAIVSMSALVLYFTSENAVRSAHDKQQAQFYVSDVIACYRVSNTTDDFTKNVAFALGLDESQVRIGDSTGFAQLPNGYTVHMTIKNEKLTVKIVHSTKTLAQGEFSKGGAIE